MRFCGKSQQKLPNFTALLAAIGEPRKGKNEQKPKISFTHRQFLLCRIDGHAGGTKKRMNQGDGNTRCCGRKVCSEEKKN
jgi:hypothetical protein